MPPVPRTRHLLSIEAMMPPEMEALLQAGIRLKALRGKKNHPRPLAGQTWGLIFAKSSTRTRVSFEVGIRELGGDCIFLGVNDIQLGRGESAEDTARVLSRYLNGIVIRTYAQSEVEAFAAVGSIPVINALTDEEHPCQILADLMTWAERLGPAKSKKISDRFKGKTVVFYGDAACNVARSWIFAAGNLGFNLRLSAPKEFQPDEETLRSAGGNVSIEFDPVKAARNADLLYTDTWISMGKEEEGRERLQILKPFQINEKVVAAANGDALVMHCLPAYRDKEISTGVFEAHAQTIFDEAENRLHIQKAILTQLAGK
jgi:ornithine carbamoyltransferase